MMTPPFWQHLRHCDVVGSTMQVAREWAGQGAPHGASVAARAQTAGRGRHGRRWESPRDAGVALTVILYPPGSADAWRGLALLAGCAVVQALETLLPAKTPLRLKWPNDVMCHGRKLAGVLLQADALQSATPTLLVGIGINVVSRHALADLPLTVAARHLGCLDLLPEPQPAPAWCIATLQRAVLEALQQRLEGWQGGGLEQTLVDVRRRDALHGQHVRIATADGIIEGVAQGIADDGGLRLQTPTGMARIAAGEVHVLSAAAGCPASQ